MKTFPTNLTRLIGGLLLLVTISPVIAAPDTPKMAPTVADVAYGPEPKQKFDIYRPTEGAGPFPILVWIHGGGWSAQDKSRVTDPTPYLAKGCAVVSLGYRLIKDVQADHISPPIVGVFADNRRALQYVRLHASEWNLDPDKIVVAGASAGACSALYLGCEGEQANPQSADPVERVSTKVLGVGAENSQSTLDPQRMREWVPGIIWGVQPFEPSGKNKVSEEDFDKFLADRDKWMPYISKYSPDILLSKDSPPIYFSNSRGIPKQGATPTPNAELVHCPLWGIGFQKLAQERGVPCYVWYPGHPSEKYAGMTDFLLSQLGLAAK
jgi:acetyl esterase/lipase